MVVDIATTSVRLPDQDLGAGGTGSERPGTCPTQPDRITRPERFRAFEGAATSREEHVDKWGIGRADLFPALQAAAPQHSAALANRDCGGMTTAGGNGHEPSFVERGIDVELLVARPNTLRVGQHPHLDEA